MRSTYAHFISNALIRWPLTFFVWLIFRLIPRTFSREHSNLYLNFDYKLKKLWKVNFSYNVKIFYISRSRTVKRVRKFKEFIQGEATEIDHLYRYTQNRMLISRLRCWKRHSLVRIYMQKCIIRRSICALNSRETSLTQAARIDDIGQIDSIEPHKYGVNTCVRINTL